MEDHIHILLSLHPTLALSDFMRNLKAESSKIRHTFMDEYVTFIKEMGLELDERDLSR
jgi:REP element-mobilizing transposase RayT